MAEADEQDQVGEDIPVASDTTDKSSPGSVEQAVEGSTTGREVDDPMETVAPDPESHPSA